jgi:hypothetical protein
MHGILRRLVIPALLLACVGIEWHRGGDSLPTWVANLSVKVGGGPDRALRIILALQILGAAVALASRGGSRIVAWAAGAALAFSGLAELSAIVAAPGKAAVPVGTWVAPLLGLAIGTWILSVMARPEPRPMRPARVTAWKAIATITAAACAAGIAGRASLAPRSGFLGVDGVETVILHPEQWVGMTLPQSGFSRQLPAITPLTLEGTKWVVFYSPTCGRCHEVFRTYFAGPQHHEVIAVRIPHAPGDEVIKGDQPEDVECEECERLSLPEGTRWIVTPPTIVKIEGGRVTCVSGMDYDRCRPASGAAN